MAKAKKTRAGARKSVKKRTTRKKSAKKTARSRPVKAKKKKAVKRKPARTRSGKAVKKAKKAVSKTRKKTAKPKKSARKPVRKAAKKVKKAVRKPARKAAKKTVKKAVKKVAKKAAQKPAKKVAAPAPVKPKSQGRKSRKPSYKSRVHDTENFVLPPLPERPKPTYTPMKQRPDVMIVPKSSKSSSKKRYSDSELREFKEIINRKLADARSELENLQASLHNANNNGTDDTATTFKMLEDGSDTLAKEEAGQLAVRQRKFIEQLENALKRIENKTYGVCRVTGKLIPKERLRAVPHTTQSIEAKMKQYRD